MSITSSIILRLRLVLVRVACNHGSRVCHLWYVQRDDCLHKAKLTDLETCPQPDCGYSMVIESDTEKVFDCHKCGSRTCRKCKADWAEHFGLRCAEVEQKSETAARRQIEETMTAALLRTCECGLAMSKADGCNKMTCRCGKLLCYICKATIPKKIGYGHFCPHPRKPGVPCKKCKKCSLWEDPSAMDAKRVKLARQEGFAAVGDKLTATTVVAKA
eukprot:m.528255 g.528255  ORF g.528255 m.528255 type:complete len:216 (-) comp22015_c0_seq27:180-827(-)